MTVDEARVELEWAGRKLETAIAQLIAGPVNNPEFCASLEASAKRMEQVKNAFQPASGNGALAALFETLHASAARAQLLLDSAATFYCGSVFSSVTDTAEYTAEGLMNTSSQSGHLQLRA